MIDDRFHFWGRMTPKPGCEDAFRTLFLDTAVHSRAEPDCHGLEIFETAAPEWIIHSIWTDEAAFERHAELPHTVRLIEQARELLTHEIKGLRARRIS